MGGDFGDKLKSEMKGMNIDSLAREATKSMDTTNMH